MKRIFTVFLLLAFSFASLALAEVGAASPPPGDGDISFDDAEFEAALSAIGTYQGEKEIYGRRNPEQTDSFIPGDYGMLYPFTGRYVYSDWGMQYGKRGFVDAGGGIVMDASADRIWPIYKDGGYGSAVSEDPAAYIMMKIKFTGYDANNNIQAEKENYVVAANGAWIAGPYAAVQTTARERLFVRSGEKWGVLDLNGVEVVKCQFEQGGDGDPYETSQAGVDTGVMWILKPGGAWDNPVGMIINTEGEVLYENSTSYMQELFDSFIVKTPEGLYGLMFPDGKWKLSPQKNPLYPLTEEYIQFSEESESDAPQYGIMDMTGKIVYPAEYRTIFETGGVIVLSKKSWNYGEPFGEPDTVFLDYSLQPVHPPSGWLVTQTFSTSDYLLWTTPQGLVLADWHGTKTYPVSSEEKCRWMDFNMFNIEDEIVNMDDGTKFSLGGEDYAQMLSKKYLEVYKDGVNALYAADGTQILPCEFKEIGILADGLFVVAKGKWEGIVNDKGEWILKISILDSIPD